MKLPSRSVTWREALKLGRVLGGYAAGEISKEEAERRIDEVHQGTSDPAADATTKSAAEFPRPPQTTAPALGGARTPPAAPWRRWQRALPRTQGRAR
jgi:hypothetical protein